MIHSKTLLGSWATPTNVTLVTGMLIGFGAAVALVSLLPETAPSSDLEPVCHLVTPQPAVFAPWTLGQLTLEQRTPPAHVTRTKDGLLSVQLQAPSASPIRPGPRDKVHVRMLGWDAQGVPLDGVSSMPLSPITMSFDAVIPGFALALQEMRPGERRRVWVPESLAYRGVQGKPQGTLIFDVELVSVVKGY